MNTSKHARRGEGEKEICESLFQMFGDRWSLRIVDALRDRPRRFREMQTALGINSATLSSRLRRLESVGVLVRQEEATAKSSVSYELTKLGSELLPIYDGMMRFGRKVAR